MCKYSVELLNMLKAIFHKCDKKTNKTKQKNVVELLTLYNFGRDVPEAFFPWPNLHTGLAEIKNHRVFSLCVCACVRVCCGCVRFMCLSAFVRVCV